jgi:hypothetical protein
MARIMQYNYEGTIEPVFPECPHAGMLTCIGDVICKHPLKNGWHCGTLNNPRNGVSKFGCPLDYLRSELSGV